MGDKGDDRSVWWNPKTKEKWFAEFSMKIASTSESAISVSASAATCSTSGVCCTFYAFSYSAFFATISHVTGMGTSVSGTEMVADTSMKSEVEGLRDAAVALASSADTSRRRIKAVNRLASVLENKLTTLGVNV